MRFRIRGLSRGPLFWASLFAFGSLLTYGPQIFATTNFRSVPLKGRQAPSLRRVRPTVGFFLKTYLWSKRKCSFVSTIPFAFYATTDCLKRSARFLLNRRRFFMIILFSTLSATTAKLSFSLSTKRSLLSLIRFAVCVQSSGLTK